MASVTPEKCQEIEAAVANIKSRRMRILESLRLTLKTITENNGYSHDLCDATFDVNGWQDKLESDTPVIFVVDEKVNKIERMAGRQRQYYWRILLFGVCKGMDIFEFEEHIADVQQCIEDNPTLCCSVSQTEVDSIATDNQLFSEKEDTHLYEIALELRYIQCYQDPR